ncbi:MAG: hypothetical protein ACXW3D_01205 [Caulobacteraceae bacterium]
MIMAAQIKQKNYEKAQHHAFSLGAELLSGVTGWVPRALTADQHEQIVATAFFLLIEHSLLENGVPVAISRRVLKRLAKALPPC